MSKELNKAPVEQAGGDERAADAKPCATRCPDCGEHDLMPGDLCACGYETDPATGYACSECDGSGEGCFGEICRECDGSGWFVTPDQARAALAQPSGEVVVTKNESGAIVSVTRQDKEGRVLSVIAESQPSPEQAEQAEAERPEVVAVMESNGAGGKRLAQRFPIVNVFVGDELMTVAQHERIVKAWIERWKAYIELSAKIAAQRDAANARLHEVATACATAEQERDAALSEVERIKTISDNYYALCVERQQQLDAALAMVSGLRSLLNPILCYVENDIERMRGDRDKSDNKETYDLAISLAMKRLKAAQHAVFTTEPGCNTAVELASHITAQAQHSVPDVCDGKEQDAFEEWARKEGLDTSCHPMHWLFLDAKTNSARQGWKAALRYVRSQLAAAPGKEVGHE